MELVRLENSKDELSRDLDGYRGSLRTSQDNQKKAQDEFDKLYLYQRNLTDPLFSHLFRTNTVETQKDNADRSVTSSRAQVNATEKEIERLTAQIDAIKKRMQEFTSANVENSAVTKKTAVRTFDTLEDLLNFENKFRVHNDVLKEVHFIVPSA